MACAAGALACAEVDSFGWLCSGCATAYLLPAHVDHSSPMVSAATMVDICPQGRPGESMSPTVL
jgi:hypothetical protein